MRIFFQNIFSSETHVALATSLLATITYCGAIVAVCVVLSLATARKDDSPLARSGASPDAATGMPL
jgi:hypothetical protein